MASTYTTNLGIEKIATGEQSGTWGATTNTNLDLIDQAVNGVVQITVAATGSTGSPNALTITNGSASDGRNKFIDFYSPTDLGGTVYYQLDPNDAEKIVFVRNSLGGGQTLVLFQGTYNASNDVEVPNGVDMLVKFDGTGASATVTNVFEKLQVNALSVNDGNITNVGDIALDSISADGTDINVSVSDNSATALTVKEGSNTYLTIDTTNSAEKVLVSKTLDIGDNNITNVGNIALDSISADGTQIDIDITDNTASAFTISEGANNYIAITTTDGSELITVSKNSTFAGTTIADLGVVTTVDINGGTADNVTIGGGTAAAGTFTTLNATGGGALTGTWSNLGTVTTVDINGGTIDGTAIGATTPSTGDFTTLTENDSPAVVQSDIGTDPDEIPLNQYLGSMAYQDADAVNIGGGTIDGVTIGGASAGAITGTTITGTSFVSSGDMTFGDDDKAIFGAGSDLQISHSGTSSRIQDVGTGNLIIDTNGTEIQLTSGSISEYMLRAVKDGAVTLYYDNAAKLATTNTGIDVTGDVGGDTLTISGEGSISGLTVGKGAGAVSTNTAVGASALAANTSGSLNTAIGGIALDANTTGAINTAVGYDALGTNTTGSQNNAFGYQALALNNGSYNNAFGVEALESNTTGGSNSAFGEAALRSNTTASNNTAVGYQAGYVNTTGTGITLLGGYAGQANTTGSNNTFLGLSAGFLNTSGNFNVSIGSQSLRSNTTASNNTAVGYQALYANTTGTNNTAVGVATLDAVTTGNGNVAFGNSAGTNVTTASSNTFIGEGSGSSTTGGSNTFLGRDAGYLVSTGTNNTILGRYGGDAGGLNIRTASNYIVLSDGDGNPRAYHDGTNWTVNGGIYIGGTAATNLLDDYEEGVFTPTLAGSTGAGSFTYSNQAGYYVKVGNKVTITFSVTLSAIGTAGTGFLRILGSPWTTSGSAAAVYARGSVTTGNVNFDGAANSLVLLPRSSSSVELVINEVLDGAASTNVSAADLTATSVIEGQITLLLIS
jgi:hypothetical protein